MRKRTPGWERSSLPKISTRPRAGPFAAPCGSTPPMRQPSGIWRSASGFLNWIQPFAGSVRRSDTGAVRRCSKRPLAGRSNVFRRSAKPRTLSLFGPGRTRRASRPPANRLAGRLTVPPSPTFRWRRNCGRPAKSYAGRRPVSMRPRIACWPPSREIDRFNGMPSSPQCGSGGSSASRPRRALGIPGGPCRS